jgi:hypothetical protein
MFATTILADRAAGANAVFVTTQQVTPMDDDTPFICRGQIWRPRGDGLTRQVLNCEPDSSGEMFVHYRNPNGDFSVSAANFRFWISRLSASLDT